LNFLAPAFLGLLLILRKSLSQGCHSETAAAGEESAFPTIEALVNIRVLAIPFQLSWPRQFLAR
jgi:hypothetical protein